MLEKHEYLPENYFRKLHGVASMWATELVLTRGTGAQKEVLLKKYDGGAEVFQGMWHIPGGYNMYNEPDVQTTCSRVAKRELGVDVKYNKVYDIYKWKNNEHPYGHPLSLYLDCSPVGEVGETDALKYFPIANLPESTIGIHANFLKTLI